MTGYSFNGLASMPGYELETGFGFNGWLRLQWLGLIRCLATTYKVTALLQAVNGLGFYGWLPATKWLRLQWLTEWLRLQWQASATMGWL
jgi:hypothetical protein